MLEMHSLLHQAACCDHRTAKKVIVENATIKKDSIASTLLTNQTLNLFGIGSALIGLQVGRRMPKAIIQLHSAALYVWITWAGQLCTALDPHCLWQWLSRP